MAASYLPGGHDWPGHVQPLRAQAADNQGFLIAAGLDDCPTFLAFAFTDANLAWLADTQGVSSQDLAAFRRLQFTGDVWAVPEAIAVFAGEPYPGGHGVGGGAARGDRAAQSRHVSGQRRDQGRVLRVSR